MSVETYLQQNVAFKAAFMKQRSSNLPEDFHYAGVDDFVLDRGTSFESSPLTSEELQVLLKAIDWCSVGRFMQKQCFYNSQMLVLSDFSDQLAYTEGYAIGRCGFAVHHGWCTLNDKVIDLTWRTEKPNHKGRLTNRIFGEFSEPWSYWGVKFGQELIYQRIAETEMSGTLIDDWERGWPLFKWDRLNSPYEDAKYVQAAARAEEGKNP